MQMMMMMQMMVQMSSTQVIFGLAAARPGKKMQQENSLKAMHYLFKG